MPLVRACLGPNFVKVLGGKLMIACDEIIPAALNCVNDENGKLEPGCIEFFCTDVHPHRGEKLTVDALIKIKAYRLPERAANLDERQEAIRANLGAIFPRTSFAVWLELATASWGSDRPDPSTPGIDMSMTAALERATARMSDLAVPLRAFN